MSVSLGVHVVSVRVMSVGAMVSQMAVEIQLMERAVLGPLFVKSTNCSF
jgi:hypothetical protein